MKRKIYLVLALLLVLLAAGAGFWAGSRWGASPSEPEPSQTFYATIIEAGDTNLLVQGLAVNDINHRGRFTVPLDKDTPILWRNEPMALSELQAGQTLSITYTGPVQESDPAGLSQITMIQLLDDEK